MTLVARPMRPTPPPLFGDGLPDVDPNVFAGFVVEHLLDLTCCG